VISVVMPIPASKLMTKAQPILLYECLETANGSETAIQHHLRQSAELSGSVPAIGTMNEYILPECQDPFQYVINRSQYIRCQVKVVRLVKFLQVPLWVFECTILPNCNHFGVGISHAMNVVDVAEQQLAISVILNVLQAATLETVCLRRRPRSCIKNSQLVLRVINIGSAYLEKYSLIILISVSHKALAALT
jgi:hypothetical protein